jgi:DNA-binding response OmpR family regulator
MNRILVVDGSREDQQTLKRALTTWGYPVDAAATGYAGLAMMDRHPDLVILDVDLPDIERKTVIEYSVTAGPSRSWSFRPVRP